VNLWSNPGTYILLTSLSMAVSGYLINELQQYSPTATALDLVVYDSR